MKKQVTIFLALLFAGATINNINAQTLRASASDALITSVKPDGFFADDLLNNVQKRFQKQFPNVKVGSWIKTKDGYAIRFTSGSVESLVFYGPKAKIAGQVRYYKKDNLLPDIRFQVESFYNNYDIISVQEVLAGSSKIYLIAIEAKNEWKIIRVSEAGMEVYKEYRKA